MALGPEKFKALEAAVPGAERSEPAERTRGGERETRAVSVNRGVFSLGGSEGWTVVWYRLWVFKMGIVATSGDHFFSTSPC